MLPLVNLVEYQLGPALYICYRGDIKAYGGVEVVVLFVVVSHVDRPWSLLMEVKCCSKKRQLVGAICDCVYQRTYTIAQR